MYSIVFIYCILSYIIHYVRMYGSRDRAVGVLTGYGLKGSGFETELEQYILHPSNRPGGPNSLLYND